MSAHETTLKFQYNFWVNTSFSVFCQITYQNCWLLKWFVMPLSFKCTCWIASTYCIQTEKCCVILLSVSPTKFSQVDELSVVPWTKVKQNRKGHAKPLKIPEKMSMYVAVLRNLRTSCNVRTCLIDELEAFDKVQCIRSILVPSLSIYLQKSVSYDWFKESIRFNLKE